jgi:uncharacterized membrane protein
MVVSNLLTPGIMIGAGCRMWKHCPKKINSWIGFRTKRSMQSMEAWKYAHTYCGKRWVGLGLFLILPSILVMLPFYGGDEDLIGGVGVAVIAAQMLFLFLPVFLTELALKKKFPDEEK